MDKAALLANLKCKIVCIFLDEQIEEDYLIDNGIDLGNRELKIKEYSLLINLLENSDYINYKDGCDTVIGCNFSKINELKHAS